MTTYIISLTLLAAAVILLRTIFRNNISSKIIYAMWLAVVLRLCLPFDLILIDMPQIDLFGEIGSVVVYEHTADGNEKVPLQQTPSVEQNGGTVLNSQQSSHDPKPALPGNTVNDGVAGTSNNIQNDMPEDTVNDIHGGVNGNVQNDVQVTLPVTAPTVLETLPQTVTPQVSTENVTEGVKLSVKQLVIAVWLAGSAVTLFVFGISWLVFKLKLVKSRRLYGKSGRTKIYVSDKIMSPCTLGVIPKIYITPEAEKSELLSVMLLHEKTHLAHGDHLWNIVRVAAVVAHWWNPVIWLSAVLSKRDAELACDEAVAKKLDSRERIEYARMIVDMTPERKNCAISFAGGPIKERVLKLTREHKNKIIVAVVAVILVAVCVTLAFIGAKDGGEGAETTGETVETIAETGTTAEETAEPEPEPETEPVYGLFNVYEATEENIAKYETVKKYDVSTSEYNFSLLLVPTEDIADLAITRLNWSEDIILEGEEIIETVGEVKAGEAVLLTTDPVEIIGYVGISYTVNGETVRYYPATSGMDGSAILVEIGRGLLSLDMLYPGLEVFEITVSDKINLDTALYALQFNENGDKVFDFAGISEKVVVVYGLSTPVYMEFSERWNVKSISAWDNIVYPANCDAYYPFYFSFDEYDGALVFKNNHDVYTESWVITPNETRALTVEDGVVTELVKNDDDTLSYKRYTVKFNQPAMTTETLVLDIATSRDELVSETGMARFEDGKLILEEADISEKVGDIYDLDGIFERYPLYFSGYDSADDILARNRRRESGVESIPVGVSVMPNENHIGSWSEGGDDVLIREVTADTVEFSAGLFRLFGFDGTATLNDGVWKFTEDSTYWSEEDKIKGRLEFTEDSVTIIYETDGRFDYLRGDVSRTFSARHYSVQSTVFVSGVVDPCTGASSSYGNKILGHYDLTCVSSESYSLTPRVTICNGGCEVSKTAPIAEYGVEDGWQYPVKVYVRDFDESVKDIYPSQYIESKRSANYVFDIGNGMHFNIWITRYDSENYNNLFDNEQELLDNIAKCCRLEYTLLNNKTGEAYPTVEKFAEVSPDHLAKAEDDIRYKWITSFIGKDVEGCAEVLQSDPSFTHRNDYTKTMAPLKDLYFGSYSVTDIEDDDPEDEDRLLFEFTVVKSDYDAYPVGYYKAELVIGSGMMFDFDVNFIERPMDPEMKSLGEDVIGKMFDTLTAVDDLFDNTYNVNFPDDPYSDEWGWRCMSEHLLKAYFDTHTDEDYHSIGLNWTTEDWDNWKFYIESWAGWIYYMNGNGPFKLHDDFYDVTDGGYYIGGHGGDKVKRDIIALNGDIAEIVNGRADIFSVDIRYYTDIAEFGEAFVVRYTFDRVASVYGLKLHKIEKIKDNGYANWRYSI